jgi:hypothetical protein
VHKHVISFLHFDGEESPLKEQLVANGFSFMHITKSLPCTSHIVIILNVCKLGIREMFTKQCKKPLSLSRCNRPLQLLHLAKWHSHQQISKAHVWKKHHAHFELLKMKVATIKLLHDFQGLHLKRHFEHKCYNKHSLKRLKALKENL